LRQARGRAAVNGVPFFNPSLGPGTLRVVEHGPRLHVLSATGEWVPKLLSLLNRTGVVTGFTRPLDVDPAKVYLMELPDHYVFLDREGNLVGGCALFCSSVMHGWMELLYAVDTEHRGKGYAVEGVCLLIEWTSRWTDAAGILALVPKDNLASLKVARRLGMKAHPEPLAIPEGLIPFVLTRSAEGGLECCGVRRPGVPTPDSPAPPGGTALPR
jgi:hypothetical protein